MLIKVRGEIKPGVSSHVLQKFAALMSHKAAAGDFMFTLVESVLYTEITFRHGSIKCWLK